MAKKKCPKCGVNAVPPSGPKEAEILIVGEAPEDDELEWGRPLVGNVGRILREELSRLGIDLRSCRVANLWIHAPTKNEECKRFGESIITREAQGRKGILLLGTNCAKMYTGHNVMEIAGLRVEEECNLIHAPVIMCSPKPTVVLKKGGVVGEVRFALEQFVKAVENL